MNIEGNASTNFHGTPVHEDGTISLKEAQEEALREAPSSPALTWRRTIQLDRVTSLLPQHLEPFDKSDRKRAYSSAIYYSECFLRGVTPKDADHAAVDVQQQYKRWWVNGTVQEGDITNINTTTGLQCDDGPDDIAVVSDDSIYRQDEQRTKRRRRRSLRDVIEDVSLSRHACHGREDDDHFDIRSIPNLPSATRQQIESVRDRVIAHLKINGDLESEIFKSGLEILQSYYLLSQCDVRQPDAPFELEGTWLALSKPTFTECKGRNVAGDQIYALGRMSFDMFRPTGLRCSIQGNFNSVYELPGELPRNIPRSLRKSIESNLQNGGVKGLRTFNVVVAFTIEPNQTRSGRLVDVNSPSTEFVLRRPIRGIMTNFGYSVPDPNSPNRLSIWFTGGQLEVNDEERDMGEWQQIFAHGSTPRRDMKEFARVLAAKVLLGADIPDTMDESGNMKYSLKRPIGGHGSAYIDVLYIDEKLRITKGHHGAMFVFSRVTE